MYSPALDRTAMDVGLLRADESSLGAGSEPERIRAHASIRPATTADNAALLALTKACPMQADISLAIERDPDFFTLSRARGIGRTYVVESEGRIVACGSVCRRRAYVLGTAATIGYVGDLRVLPDHRRSGYARRIVEAIAADEGTEDPAPYVGSAAAGNRAVDELVRAFPGIQPVVRLGTFTAFQLLPLPHHTRRSPAELIRAEAADEQELAELLDAYHRRFTLAPVFSDGGLRRLLAVSPGMDLDSYRIARRGGRIVAALGVWDASAVKQTRVRRLPRHLRRVTQAMRGIGRIVPLPPFPVEGQLLHHVYLRHAAYAPGALPALAGLVRAVMGEVAREGYHFALFTCADGDPITGCVHRRVHLKYRYCLYAGSNAADYAPRLEAMRGVPLFDDAALA